MKAFIEDIRVLQKTVRTAKTVLERIGNLIKFPQMKIKSKKFKSCKIFTVEGSAICDHRRKYPNGKVRACKKSCSLV